MKKIILPQSLISSLLKQYDEYVRTLIDAPHALEPISHTGIQDPVSFKCVLDSHRALRELLRDAAAKLSTCIIYMGPLTDDYASKEHGLARIAIAEARTTLCAMHSALGGTEKDDGEDTDEG